MSTKKGIKSFTKTILDNCLLSSETLFYIVKQIKPQWRKLVIKSLESYAKDNNAIKYVINEEETYSYKKAAPGKDEYETWKYNEIILRQCTKQYIACLDNVYVRGDTDAILTDGLFLTDKILFDRNGFMQHLPGRTSVKGDKCIIYQKSNADKSIDKAISLVKMWSYSYFHFVFEGLSRLGEIDSISEYDNWPIIIDSCVKKDPRNLEIIDFINYKNREIIWIDSCEIINVKRLVVPPCLSWAIWDVPMSVKNGWGYMIDSRAGLFLRNTVLRQYSPKKNYNCVYVARGNNKRLLNEDLIIEYFSQHGFEIFYPDKAIHFEDEVDCFATANCIISCAGGASTNYVFCKPTVDIYCLLPFEFRCDGSQDVTQTVGITSHMVDGIIKENGGLLMTSTFEIPIEKCRKIVDVCKRKGYI